jgi:hypothetical protein
VHALKKAWATACIEVGFFKVVGVDPKTGKKIKA